MNEHINYSNSVGAGGLTTRGGQLCVSVPSRCNHLPTAWLSPAPVAGAGRRRRRCSARNGRIDCSNSVGAGGFTTGSGRLCVSVTSRCNNFSTAGTSGVGAEASMVVCTLSQYRVETAGVCVLLSLSSAR